jgi:cytochrome c5
MMKLFRHTSWTVFLSLFLVACTSSKTANANKEDINPELALAKEKVTGMTMDQLKQGSRMYIRKCSGCHALHKPSQFTAQQWHPILMKMFERSKVKDSTTKALITNYLVAKSK